MAKKEAKKRGRPKGSKNKKKPARKKVNLSAELDQMPMKHVKKRNTWFERLEKLRPDLAAQILDIVERWLDEDPKVRVRLPNITVLHRWLTENASPAGWESCDRQAFAKFVQYREKLRKEPDEEL